MNIVRYNKSKTYLLPLLSEVINLDLRFFYGLKNTYISDDLDLYKNCLYILHEFSFKNPAYTDYEHRLINSEYFVDLIDIGKDVLYVFKFPDVYLHEYEKFKESKYSYFGTDAKNLILSFYTEVYQDNINAVGFLVKVKQILFKDDKLRRKIEDDLGVYLEENAELTDAIEMEEETFELSKYAEKIDK